MDTPSTASRDVAIRTRYELADEIGPATPQDAATVDAEGRRLSMGIEGVVYARLVSHVDHRGSLTEIVNFDHEFWDEPVIYSYCFTIAPGRIKGWGMHHKQADRYFLASGNVRVVLYDGRVRSPSHGQFAQFHMTGATRALLLIPPGVWHADQNWGDTEAVMINHPTRPFDHADPDKHRIDPASGLIPFDFTLPDG